MSQETSGEEVNRLIDVIECLAPVPMNIELVMPMVMRYFRKREGRMYTTFRYKARQRSSNARKC